MKLIMALLDDLEHLLDRIFQKPRAEEQTRKTREKIVTTESYWDCECEHNYIHPSTMPECLRCGAKREDQPDSRVNEVQALGLPRKPKRKK